MTAELRDFIQRAGTADLVQDVHGKTRPIERPGRSFAVTEGA